MHLEFPAINNPIAIFTLIIILILFVPFLCKKMGIPSIFGLIISGLIIGPHGLGLLKNIEGINVFASVGLLYIMFLAGLEINFDTFIKNRNKSLVFGLATFILPLALGFPVLYFLLGYSFLPSLLIASMFSTHTLLSYPIVSRLNIHHRESVVVTIGGTIFTDTAVLILLSIITAAYGGGLNGFFWIKLLFSLTAFVILVLWGLPKVARWYFNSFNSDGKSHYVFVMASLFISAMLAKFAGIEPIVGAFLSGLALNRVIPPHSPLMNRTEFIGNSLFIPVFLISVGMLVDLKIILKGFDTLLLSAILITIAVAGKYLAAMATKLIFRYSKADGALIFGLSASHAAATIAIILVGYNMGILNEKVLNGTILLILITSMISTFITENASRKIVLEKNFFPQTRDHQPDKILIPIAKADSLETLINFALVTKIVGNESKIYPLYIKTDGLDDYLYENDKEKSFIEILQHTSSIDPNIIPLTRVDINIPTGISHTIKELNANKIILEWKGRSATAKYLFGDKIDNLLESTQIMIIVTKIKNTLFRYRKILVLVPANADKEVGFYAWVDFLIDLSKNSGGKILFLSNNATIETLSKRLQEYKIFNEKNFISFDFYPSLKSLPVLFDHGDLIAFIASREDTISYKRRQIIIPKVISEYPDDINFIVIYPEQIEKPLEPPLGLDFFYHS
jgi:Kef-type K+ transport system membrane component KefB